MMVYTVVYKVVKIEIDVQKNIYEFVKSFSQFSGKPVEEMFSEHAVGLKVEMLGWWSDINGVTVEDLKRKYCLETP